MHIAIEHCPKCGMVRDPGIAAYGRDKKNRVRRYAVCYNCGDHWGKGELANEAEIREHELVEDVLQLRVGKAK